MQNDKVVIICPTFPPYPCGVGKHTSFLINHLKKYTNTLVLITSGNINADIKNIGIDVNTDINDWSWKSLFTLFKIIKKENPYLIHLEYPTKINGNKINIILLPIVVRLLLQKPILITQHEFMDSSWKGKIRNILLLLFANYVIFPNSIDRDLMSNFVPFLKRRSEIIHIGSTIEKWETNFNKSSAFVISFIGFLDPSKGFETILYAIKELRKENVKLEVLTKFDPKGNDYHYKINKLIDSLGVKDKIEFRDTSTDRLVSLGLQESDVVVLPYVKGATLKRSTILDAFSHEVPVISTKTKYTPNDFNQSNIILVGVGDYTALKNEILNLMKDRKKIDNLKQGMKVFTKSFNWDEIAKKTLLVYNKFHNK